MAKQYENSVPGLVIRQAEEADCGLILELIHGIAKYEKMEDQVVATEESLRESIFVRNRADVLIAEYEGRSVNGHVLYLIRQDIRRFEKEHGEIDISEAQKP